MTRRQRSTPRPAGRQRRPEPLVPARSILVACEGSKTEPNYFRQLREELRSRAIHVEIVRGTNKADPLHVVRRAIERRDRQKQTAKTSDIEVPFDETWCVIDVEAPLPHGNLDTAIDEARRRRIKLALTNPCFEYWYLLHFEKTGSSFASSVHVVRALRRHAPGYSKGDARIFRTLFPNTRTAISRAEEILRDQWHSRNDLRPCNPATRVHLLVRELLQAHERPYRPAER